MVNVNISREQNKMVRELVRGSCSAHKNWIASAVESGNIEYANKLVKDLRAYEELLHAFIPDELIKEA